jgi:DNA repair protein RadC
LPVPAARRDDVTFELSDIAVARPDDRPQPAVDGGERQLIELLHPLCGVSARSIAAGLMLRFGSLPAVLRADRRALARALPGRPGLVRLLRAVPPIAESMLRTEMLDSPVLPDNRAAIRYLHAAMAHEPAEHVRILYLDAKNRLLAAEVASRGSIARTDIVPREIVRRALETGATGLIMAHNHPSGDPTPSRHDLAATRAVAEAGRLFEIRLHDHIIISRGGHRSLREEGYL